MNDQEYAGFWIRAGATMIDSILLCAIFIPIFISVYGIDFYENSSASHGFFGLFLNYVLPAALVIFFWIYKAATPGKMATKLTIVDARTGGKPSSSQLIIRYFAYYLSLLPLCLGIIWVCFDKRKQGWHDKLAGTVVIRNVAVESLEFEVQN